MSFSQIAATLCVLWCLAATGIVAWRLQQTPAPIDTDIQSMLPDSDSDPVLRAAMLRAGEAASGRIALLVAAPDPANAEAAGAALRGALDNAKVFVADSADAESTGRWLFANRNELLCEADPAQFDDAAADRTARSALAALYSPIAPVNGDMLAADPFLLTLRLSQCLSPVPAGVPADATLISGRLTASAFRLDTQAAVTTIVEDWRAAWEPKGVTLQRAGAIFHAAAAADRAKTEVAIIGGVGGIGVILLFWLAYRRFKAVLIAVSCVYVGLVGGLAAALLVFPSVHIMVFVFGATLIGVVSDYAVHFLSTGPATRWAGAAHRLKLIGRPITVSMITTTLAFAAMALFHAPLFAQVAVFATAGLVTAWAFVLAVLPRIDTTPRNSDALAAHWRRLEDLRSRIIVSPALSGACAVAILGAVAWGGLHLTYLDDPRAFQPKEAALLAEERVIRAVGESTFAPAFLLSEGNSAAEARAVEEAALARLDRSDILATSRFDPSPARRAENAVRIEAHLLEPRLAGQLAAVGLDPSTVDARRSDAVEPPRWLEAWRGATSGRHYLVAPILADGVQDVALPPGARLVTPADHYATTFRAYRGFATGALLAAMAAAGLILLAAYRRLAALAILVAPLAGVTAGLAIPAAFGEPISFFSLVAALVLLGVGVDYSAFQWEAGRDGDGREDRWTAVALPIDAATTALSMGLLMFSATQPLRNFGLTIAIGVAAALIFSYVPRVVARRSARKSIGEVSS
ncbi:MAG: MMPL family transporter [Hyphomonadaceae bacterium]|nr:MMPL family transporter [Hyphomonadaceae bacterium]